MAGVAYSADCFSPSYSVQKGRGELGELIPRDLAGSEYQDLKRMFEDLPGAWKGTGIKFVCEGTEQEILGEMEKFSITATAAMGNSGEFSLESTVSSQENRTTHGETLRLYLSSERLATEHNISEADIELISVSKDELGYVKSSRGRGYYNSAFKNQELVTRIRKKGASALEVGRWTYIRGRLIIIDKWSLEKN
jgi:hypothetical protein